MDPAENVFDGPVQPLPVPRDQSTSDFVQAENAALTRHVSGYGPFLSFCAAQQVRPQDLAGDLPALVSFLREHFHHLQSDPALAAAATVFTGNALTGLRADAQWQQGTDGSVTVDAEGGRFEISVLVEHLHLATDDQIDAYLDDVEDWAHWEPVPTTAPPPTPVGAAGYRRPPLPQQVFHTPEGRPIAYGKRWEEDDPPEEAYSRITHPERFAGLHQVADALVDHLTGTYEVQSVQDLSCAQDLLYVPDHPTRATRLTPARPDAAPLTIVCTSEPGVLVHAGLLCELPFPDCSCDACDETAPDQADELEQFVLAVAAGAFRERYPVGRRRAYEYAWASPDGSSEVRSSGEIHPDQLARIPAQDIERRLAGVSDGWRPWPLRPR